MDLAHQGVHDGPAVALRLGDQRQPQPVAGLGVAPGPQVGQPQRSEKPAVPVDAGPRRGGVGQLEEAQRLLWGVLGQSQLPGGEAGIKHPLRGTVGLAATVMPRHRVDVLRPGRRRRLQYRGDALVQRAQRRLVQVGQQRLPDPVVHEGVLAALARTDQPPVGRDPDHLQHPQLVHLAHLGQQIRTKPHADGRRGGEHPPTIQAQAIDPG